MIPSASNPYSAILGGAVGQSQGFQDKQIIRICTDCECTPIDCRDAPNGGSARVSQEQD
ncbi:MAG: hypothetical protein ACM3ML_10450 [Micromonosporaceae bacterium]